MTLALAILVLLVLAALYGTLRGPTMADRLIAGTLAASLLTFVLAVAGVLMGSDLYFDAALVAALISFASTAIVAKFLAEGRVL